MKRWYNSPEYQKIVPGRLDNSTGRAFIVESASLAGRIGIERVARATPWGGYRHAARLPDVDSAESGRAGDEGDCGIQA
jgi:hypothetical protein